MSCISGVGGDVPSLVKLAQSGRPIIALDGCVLACVKNCLAPHGVTASYYRVLSDMGVRKKYHQDYDLDQANRLLEAITSELGMAAVARTTD